MADISGLADLIRQKAFYDAGGDDESSLDKINKIFGTINTGTQNVMNVQKIQQESVLNALKKKQAEIEIDKNKRDQTPFRDIVAPISTTPAESPEAQSGRDELIKRRDALGPMTLGEKKDISDIGLKNAQASYYSSGDKGGDKLWVNPLTREVSSIEKPGYIKVSANTGATIAAGPAKEEAVAGRQEDAAIRSAAIKEASENRAKYKADLDLIKSVKDNIVAAKENLNNVTPGIFGAGQTLLGKTGLGYADAATYDRTANAMSVSLYRALTGDTRLSDSDAAARARPLLPSANQNEAQRKQLWDFIEKAIARREQFLNQGIKEVPWEKITNQSSIQTPGLDQSSQSILDKYGVK